MHAVPLPSTVPQRGTQDDPRPRLTRLGLAAADKRISDFEPALHPELAELRTVLDKLLHTAKLRGRSRLRVSLVVAIENANLLRTHSVQKERRVRCDQQLRGRCGTATLFP